MLTHTSWFDIAFRTSDCAIGTPCWQRQVSGKHLQHDIAATIPACGIIGSCTDWVGIALERASETRLNDNIQKTSASHLA
ncbi:hypothetical protein CI238_13025 [Colletotrichum incanum]|uniref:Uncharacterized protein n=1 Tax=Colletotrichum incanum TaxID=1573173 RepID=A0A167AFI5_COLIC|nr:hypothetical protein CI238_13025 [Colletotrichum incanum]